MNKKIYISVIALLLCAVMCLGLFAGCTGNGSAITTTGSQTTTTTSSVTSGPNGDEPDKDPEYTASILALIDLIFENFSIYDVDRNEAMLAAINAYVMATGDKYAIYMTPEEWAKHVEENNGDLCGVGVTVVFDYDELYIEVVSIIPDSPASQYLQIGDKLTHFYRDDEFVSISSLIETYMEKYAEIYSDEELIKTNAAYDAYEEALANVRGEVGTFAKIKVDRNGEELTFSIPRAKVKTQSVIYKRSQADPSVGILWITSFDLTTPVQFKAAMDSLIASGVDKFVFDVRQNPGGDVASVSAVLSTLLQEGDTIISTKDSNGKYETKRVGVVNYAPSGEGEADYTTCNVTQEDIGKYSSYKMAVIANEDSASAAELFTAALRDHGLAETVGTKTYGKGSVQSWIDLSYYGEAYIGMVKLTTKLYFPPCGEGYDGIGITPDHYVELPEEVKKISLYKLTEDNDDQLKKAIEILIDFE